MPVWLLWTLGGSAVAAAGAGAYGVGTKVGDAIILGGVVFALVAVGRN